MSGIRGIILEGYSNTGTEPVFKDPDNNGQRT
ncbi:hypothetical protein GGGNBK_19435 [Sporosarcina sp. ANT_H38]